MSSDKPYAPEESAESTPSENTAHDEGKAPENTEPTTSDEAPTEAKVVPIQEAKVTCERFVRRKGELGTVFAQMMRMANNGKVQKRLVKEWTKRYDEWIKAPRG